MPFRTLSSLTELFVIVCVKNIRFFDENNDNVVSSATLKELCELKVDIWLEFDLYYPKLNWAKVGVRT